MKKLNVVFDSFNIVTIIRFALGRVRSDGGVGMG